MTYQCSFRVRHASLQIDFLHSTLQNRSTWTVIIFPWWQVNFQMNRVSATGVPPYWQPPSTPSILLTCDLKLYLHSHSITASNITSVWPPSSSLSLLDLSLKVYLQTHSNTASQCISKLAWSQLQTLYDYGLQVPFETCSILTLQFIQLGHPSASSILLNYGVHMCSLEFNLISMCRHTSNVSPAQLAVSSNTYHV
jgi:hypothetical protein